MVEEYERFGVVGGQAELPREEIGDTSAPVMFKRGRTLARHVPDSG